MRRHPQSLGPLTLLRIADRHVLKQIALPLAGAMSIGLLMLLAERLVRLLDNTLGKKNSFAVVFEMLAYLVPHYLSTAISAALFLGLLLGFGRMSANSEIDAFTASGVSLNRLARPVIALSVLLCAATMFIVGWLQPYTRYAYRSIVFDVQNIEVFYLAEEGVFMQAGTRTFILDKLERGKNAFERAFIYEDLGADGSDTVTATRGSLLEVPGDSRPVLHLEQGHRITFKKAPASGGAEVTPEVAEFAIADTPLGRVANKIFRPRGDDERELTFPELLSRYGAPPSGTTKERMWMEIHKRLLTSTTVLILPFLAVPFAIGNRRSQKGYRFGFALVLIVIFHQIIEQGSVAAGEGRVSPLVALWIPFVLLAAFAAWRYWRACFSIVSDPLDKMIDYAGEFTTNLRVGIARKFSRASGA